MSVPVLSNSDIPRQIFLFNRAFKISGLIWGLNKVFWSTLQPGTRKCGKWNGKSWWQMEPYWEAKKPIETCGQYTESNSGAQQKPVGRTSRSEVLSCHTSWRSGPFRSNQKKQSMATEQCSNPFDIHVSLLSAYKKGILAIYNSELYTVAEPPMNKKTKQMVTAQ